MKKYYVDELKYNFKENNIYIRGWVIINRVKKSELYIYIDNKEYKKAQISTTRSDVNLLFQDHIKNNEEAVSFDTVIELDLENLKTFELILKEEDKIVIREKILLNKDILLKLGNGRILKRGKK